MVKTSTLVLGAATGLLSTLPSTLASTHCAVHLSVKKSFQPVSPVHELIKRTIQDQTPLVKRAEASITQATDIPIRPTLSETSALPPVVTQASEGTTGVVPIYNSNEGTLYTIEVDVGGSNLTVVLDTGSTALWVPSSDCPTCTNASMVLSTLSGDNSTGSCHAAVSYGLGSAVGCDYTADVSIAGGLFHLEDFPTIAITAIDSGIAPQGTGMSGIMGVGAKAASPKGTETFPVALYSQGFIDSPTMGLYLSRGDEQDSEVTFGNITLSSKVDTTSDGSVYLRHQPPTQGHFASPPLNALYFVGVDGVKVDGQQISGNTTAVLDSGTSFLAVPPQELENITKHVYGDEVTILSDRYVAIPCNATVPPVSVTFGGKDWSLESEDLFSLPTIDDPSLCLAATQPSPDEYLWIMGDPVMRNFYTAHDLLSSDITLYPLKK